jgi:transcriptional regulator with XRE-family HTH domain
VSELENWLSTTLRELRRDTGLSGTEVARRVGTSQRRISDLERGKYTPREDEINMLAELYEARVTTRRQMIRVVRDLSSEPPKARAMIARHGAYKMQRRIRRAEADSARIRSFQPCMVIGTAQTPAYMRAVFSSGGDLAAADLEKAIAERVARAEILGTERDITLIQAEGALRWQAGSPAVMTEQIDHLAEVSTRPGVRVGVIPWTTAVNSFPRSGFHIFDSRSVTAATDAATTFFTDPADVALYEKLWDELTGLASWSDEARGHLERIAADYRGLRNPRDQPR